MAQTVALYRGQVSLTHNTTGTFVTNTSSGTATRMIFGALSVSTQNGSNCPTPFLKIINVRSGGVQQDGVMVALYNAPGNIALGNKSFSVGNSDRTPKIAAAATNLFTYGPYLLGNLNPTTTANFVTLSATAADVGYMDYMAQNFYMGPSDTLAYQYLDNGGNNRSAYLNYVIIGITES